MAYHRKSAGCGLTTRLLAEYFISRVGGVVFGMYDGWASSLYWESLGLIIWFDFA